MLENPWYRIYPVAPKGATNLCTTPNTYTNILKSFFQTIYIFHFSENFHLSRWPWSLSGREEDEEGGERHERRRTQRPGPRRRRLQRRPAERQRQQVPQRERDRRRRNQERSTESVFGQINSGFVVRKEGSGQIKVIARSKGFPETSGSFG